MKLDHCDFIVITFLTLSYSLSPATCKLLAEFLCCPPQVVSRTGRFAILSSPLLVKTSKTSMRRQSCHVKYKAQLKQGHFQGRFQPRIDNGKPGRLVTLHSWRAGKVQLRLMNMSLYLQVSGHKWKFWTNENAGLMNEWLNEWNKNTVMTIQQQNDGLTLWWLEPHC